MTGNCAGHDLLQLKYGIRVEQVEDLLIDVVTSSVIRVKWYLLAYKVGQLSSTIQNSKK